MRVLLVTPYPPARDGLASYAVQLAKSLRGRGDTVEVVSPAPSGAEHSADFSTVAGLLSIMRLSRRADRTLVQFHPLFFLPGPSRLERLRQVLTLGLLFRWGRNLEVYVHEADYGAAARAGIRLAVLRWMWQQARRVLVHTNRERGQIIEAFQLDPSRVGVVEHGAGFIPKTHGEKIEARSALGIADRAFVFLCIGFIQPHKGFDRAARCFELLGKHPDIRLDIVGSVRVSTPEHDAYLRMLRRMIAANPAAHLHESYVNDVLFDRWILASDVVVLPYRQIWSSSVMERAGLFEKATIITPVGGLPDQARGNTVVVRNEAEMVAAMAQLAGVTPPAAGPSDSADGTTGREWAQRVITERARSLRSWHEPLADVRVQSRFPTQSIPALSLPLPPRSMGPKAVVLRVVHRLTRWELWPIVDHVNQLRWALVADGTGEESERATSSGAGADVEPDSADALKEDRIS
ncbi:MAG: glycosyltransferase family 4 protein [Candidatus Dormibacteraeota bacterium]|nr:glycosyltransferase family 4 protein [Candidatus Dormibacteraeota bacterium]MBV9524899.1 glycosyltransferase family 4 protein [Candidatus Dormibacteraeota bacterium]